MRFKENLTKVEFVVGLVVRTGDTFTVEKWDGPGDLEMPTYAVALFEAPDLGDLGLTISSVAQKTSMVAAGVAFDGWGWIPVEANTKNIICDLLEAAGARPNEWFRLTVTYTNPLTEQKAGS